MHTLPPYRRLLLLTEGSLGVFTSKAAASVLRYRPDDVVAVIDSHAAGDDIRQHIPWAASVPVLPDVAAARELQPDALFIGVTPVGGDLPDAMRRPVHDGLATGLDVVSGLHTFLADDPEFAALAQQHNATIHDLRRPPAQRIIASRRACATRCRRVLTVGTDGNVGKMVASLQLAAAARTRGLDARFVATGQTGIMIAGHGITVDACIADFAAGAAEELVLAEADADVCFIEGQGSIGHPGFSGVTLSLLHGTCPHALVLVHAVDRTHYRASPDEPLPPMRALISTYEQAAAMVHPARVAGVALNTFSRPDDEAQQLCAALEDELRLPVVDPVRHDCTHLLDVVMSV